MYQLWGLAEDRDFAGSFPRPFWSWLLRVCDRHHGYTHSNDGIIVPNSGESP